MTQCQIKNRRCLCDSFSARRRKSARKPGQRRYLPGWGRAPFGITKPVDGAIVGLRRPGQASLITAAASLTLSDEEISEIAG